MRKQEIADKERLLDKRLRDFRDKDKVSQDNTYNGWTNYETWAVNLHLTNDETLYHMALSFDSASDLQESLSNGVYQMIEEYQEKSIAPIYLLWQDLLTSSLQSVNWYEIYDGLHEDEEEDS